MLVVSKTDTMMFERESRVPSICKREYWYVRISNFYRLSRVGLTGREDWVYSTRDHKLRRTGRPRCTASCNELTRLTNYYSSPFQIFVVLHDHYTVVALRTGSTKTIMNIWNSRLKPRELRQRQWPSCRKTSPVRRDCVVANSEVWHELKSLAIILHKCVERQCRSSTSYTGIDIDFLRCII